MIDGLEDRMNIRLDRMTGEQQARHAENIERFTRLETQVEERKQRRDP